MSAWIDWWMDWWMDDGWIDRLTDDWANVRWWWVPSTTNEWSRGCCTRSLKTTNTENEQVRRWLLMMIGSDDGDDYRWLSMMRRREWWPDPSVRNRTHTPSMMVAPARGKNYDVPWYKAVNTHWLKPVSNNLFLLIRGPYVQLPWTMNIWWTSTPVGCSS